MVLTNLLPNPSFEVGLVGVLSSGTASVSRSTTFATPHGDAFLTWSVLEGATVNSGWVRQDFPVEPSTSEQWMGFSVLARRSSGVEAVRMFYQARQGGVNLTSEYLDGFALTATSMMDQERLVTAGVIPPGTDTVTFWLRPSGAPNSGASPSPGVIHTDGWMAVAADTEAAARAAVQVYWDGDNPLPGHITWWAGEVGASASHMAVAPTPPPDGGGGYRNG